MAKKLTPASLISQKKWSSLPVSKKNNLRKMLPDNDKDGVPNKFDCRPKNKRRQEGFLSDDARYLEDNPEIETAERIGEGAVGTVFNVKGNKNLVVKLQRDYTGARKINGPAESVQRIISSGKRAIDSEALSYSRYPLNSEPLFIPSKIVKMKNNGFVDGDFTGIVRPKVTPVFDENGEIKPSIARRLTDALLESLRQKVIELSRKGYRIEDSLQVGFDRAGRLLLFDVGYLERENSGSYIAYKKNRTAWLWFLANTGKITSSSIYNNKIPSKYEITEAECGVKDW